MAAFDVIIVGAGPAGIAAGCRLLAKGVNRIALLEAEDRVGGRIHSVPFGDGIVDLGAQFCHGEKGNVVYDMAHPLNLLESTMSLHSSMGFVESTGHMVDEDIGSWLLDVCLDITDDAGENLKNYKHSLGKYVTAEFNKRVKAEGAPKNLPVALQESFLEWFHRFENSYDGSDSWFETSGSGQTEYIDCEGDPELVWKDGGFKKVLDLLMNKFPDPSLALPLESKIYFRKVVNKIEWNHTDHGKVTILCQDGSEFQADRVVVTVSLGVLKANSQELFVPPLPQGKLNVINGLAIGAVDKIFLKFPETWWPEDIHGFSLIWTKADYDQFLSKYGEDAKKYWLKDIFGFYKDVGQPGVLCGWISGPGARAMEACSEQEVQEGCEEILHQFLGRMYKIPKIQALSRSQWSSNPYFRGSYSFRSMKSEEMKVKAKDLAEPLENNNHKKVLLFAGEATHQYFYSTVHGAIETGWREADRIIKYLTHNK